MVATVAPFAMVIGCIVLLTMVTGVDPFASNVQMPSMIGLDGFSCSQTAIGFSASPARQLAEAMIVVAEAAGIVWTFVADSGDDSCGGSVASGQFNVIAAIAPFCHLALLFLRSSWRPDFLMKSAPRMHSAVMSGVTYA